MAAGLLLFATMAAPGAYEPKGGSAASRHASLTTGIAGESLAIAYIAAIGLGAWVSGAFYVLFPELGALSHDVFTRPRGTWARAPLMLAITPPLAGVIGIAVTRHLEYGMVSVLMVVCASIALVIGMRSPVAPSISAGLLPLVVEVRSWWYPPAILFGTSILALASVAWRRRHDDRGEDQSVEDRIENTLEMTPEGLSGMAPLIAFVALAAAAAELTGLRFILFPPLVVIGFEMFAHADACPWAEHPMRLPVVCFLTAAGGLGSYQAIGNNPVCAAVSMAWGVGMLRLFDLHVPPALAVALLPMVMDHPRIAYPFSVGLGTLLLTLWFRGWTAARRPR